MGAINMIKNSIKKIQKLIYDNFLLAIIISIGAVLFLYFYPGNEFKNYGIANIITLLVNLMTWSTTLISENGETRTAILDKRIAVYHYICNVKAKIWRIDFLNFQSQNKGSPYSVLSILDREPLESLLKEKNEVTKNIRDVPFLFVNPLSGNLISFLCSYKKLLDEVIYYKIHGKNIHNRGRLISCVNDFCGLEKSLRLYDIRLETIPYALTNNISGKENSVSRFPSVLSKKAIRDLRKQKDIKIVFLSGNYYIGFTTDNIVFGLHGYAINVYDTNDKPSFSIDNLMDMELLDNAKIIWKNKKIVN